MTEKGMYSAEQLKEFCVKLLKSVIPNDEDCLYIVECLVQANLRGVDTHGVVRLATYYNRFKTINWKSPELISDNMATALFDGNNAPGQICGRKAMDLAIKKADQYGIGIAGVKNSNHFGTAAYYSMLATEKGMVGFTFSNSSPRLAPWGGKEPVLGNNPWSFSFPTQKGFPITLDMSNSVVAAGKIRQAAAKGEKIPLGWATDKEGNITQNAEEALKGLLLPIGDHKGYGITLVVDLLSGVLTGSGFGPQIKRIDDTGYAQKVGHLFGAIKISNFMPMEMFYERIDHFADLIKNSEKAPGTKELYLPGEIEYQISKKRLINGIPLSEDAISKLNKLAKELGIEKI